MPDMSSYSLACAQALQHALHSRPWDAELWALHALLAAQLASVHPAAHRCRSAEAACTASLAAVQRAGMPVGRHPPVSTSDQCSDGSVLAAVRGCCSRASCK